MYNINFRLVKVICQIYIKKYFPQSELRVSFSFYIYFVKVMTIKVLDSVTVRSIHSGQVIVDLEAIVKELLE